jgi:hypothetical protein
MVQLMDCQQKSTEQLIIRKFYFKGEAK